MECVNIIPSKLKGTIEIPPSKSISHRGIICASLSDGISNISNLIFSDDIKATLKGMNVLGAKEVDIKSEMLGRYNVSIKGTKNIHTTNNKIDCIESGSTLRFLIPLGALTNEEMTFKGKGKLIERPLKQYYKIFEEQNIEYTNDEGKLPLTIKGKLKSGEFKLKGNVSSQFITGLMFALPLLKGDSTIILTTELESKGYVDLTIDILRKFSIEIDNNDYKEFYIRGNQRYVARDYRVEGDFSQGAFWIVAGILGENIKCNGLDVESLQGDKAILNIVKEMQGDIDIKDNYINTKTSQTKGTIVDASQCPDIVPIVAVLGALSEGTTKIINAERLRIKESDRLKAISNELNKLGAEIEEQKDGLIIKGKKYLKGGKVDSWNDHRIAMALAVATIKCKNPVTITNSDAVSKSYPHFWEDFKNLGGVLS